MTGSLIIDNPTATIQLWVVTNLGNLKFLQLVWEM